MVLAHLFVKELLDQEIAKGAFSVFKSSCYIYYHSRRRLNVFGDARF